VVRLSAVRNCSIYTAGDILVTQFPYRLSRPKGHSGTRRITSMKISKTLSGIESVTFRAVARCLNQLRHRVPFIINSMLLKFCSLRCYSKFESLYKFLCSTFSVMNYFRFTFFPWIMTSSLIDFNIPEGKERWAKTIISRSQNSGEVGSV